jgi:3-hydroxyacyl-CoA dehydrogenase
VNFIGNRIGCFLMLSGLHLAKPFLLEGMKQESIDAVLGKPVGLPPTGLYGLIDLIGLDIMDLVGKNLLSNLPEGDIGLAYTSFPDVEQRMLERGQLGRKSRAAGGFGRVQKLDDGSKKKETFDLLDEEWRDTIAPLLTTVPSDLGSIMFEDSMEGELAWQVIGGTLRYAADLIPEISDDVVNIDRAIRWGFAWVKGPFELLDVVGPLKVVEKIEAEGGEIPAMLRVLRDAGSTSFYRADGTEFLGLDGEWHSAPPE